MNVSKQEFIAEVLRRAEHLRALEAARRPLRRSTTKPDYFRRGGRSPKPIEDREATLEDAFDEIEPSIESEIDPDY